MLALCIVYDYVKSTLKEHSTLVKCATDTTQDPYSPLFLTPPGLDLDRNIDNHQHAIRNHQTPCPSPVYQVAVERDEYGRGEEDEDEACCRNPEGWGEVDPDGMGVDKEGVVGS